MGERSDEKKDGGFPSFYFKYLLTIIIISYIIKIQRKEMLKGRFK